MYAMNSLTLSNYSAVSRGGCANDEVGIEGLTYLQRCRRSTYKQTQGLGYECCRCGQSHKQQVAASFWRLFSHPVHYAAVHDRANHLWKKE